MTKKGQPTDWSSLLSAVGVKTLAGSLTLRSTDPQVTLNLTVDTSPTDPFLDVSLLRNDVDADDTLMTQVLLGGVANDDLGLAKKLGPLTPSDLPRWVQRAATELDCRWQSKANSGAQGLTKAQATKLVTWLLGEAA